MRPVTKSELTSAREMLARAFENDPMFCFVLPDARTRREWVGFVMGAMLAMSEADGHIFTVDGGGLVSAILLTPPGRYPTPRRRLLAYLASSKSWPSLPSPRFIARILRLLALTERLHMREPHWYVQVIGVEPAHQGTGLGGKLLGAAAKMADDAQTPMFLETSNPKNIAYYRRFGFETVDSVSLSGGYPPLWTMRRNA